MQNLDRIMIGSLFAAYVGKILILGSSAADAAIVSVLAAAHFLYNWQIKNTEITQLKQELTNINEKIKQVENQQLDIKNAVAGVKITQGLRNVK